MRGQGGRAYWSLREDILEGRLPAGAALSEVELSKRLGVSRTPVRAALQRLAQEGLVSTPPPPGRGSVVARISVEDVIQLFQMREALETYAARLAARRVDPEMFRALREELQVCRSTLETANHGDDFQDYYDLLKRFDDAIDTAAANPHLLRALQGLRGQLYRLRRIAGSDPARMRQTANEHLSICLAICDGDETLAAQAVAVHIHNSLQHILGVLMEQATGAPSFLGFLSDPDENSMARE